MKPIIFNTEMVKTILDGRKTQFRIPIKLKDNTLTYTGYIVNSTDKKRCGKCSFGIVKERDLEYIKPKYKIGDIFYVKEKCVDEYPNGFCFKEDYEEDWNDKYLTKQYCNKFNARIFLKITNARVERLHEIGVIDVIKEGCPKYYFDGKIGTKEQVRDWWINLWNSTSKDGHKWEDNPYVFVYEFEILKKSEVN